MNPRTVEFDSATRTGESARIVGTYFPSAAEDAGGPVLVCMPGGTYDRGYFDLAVPGFRGYSFARYAAARGYGVVTLDMLGTGASSRPDHEIGIHDAAAANAAAVAAMPAVLGESGPFLAVGHSIGGYVAMRQQADAHSYAGLVILGTTNQYVAQRPLPDEIYAAARTPEGRAALVARIEAAIPEPFTSPDRAPMRSWFYLDDVPDAVWEADCATTLTVAPRRASAEALVPGNSTAAAAAVDVPVLLVYGEVDVSPDPHREPGLFSASPDVTLYLLPSSGHCHNMAGTRHMAWDRLLAWCDAVVASADDGGRSA